MCGKRKGTFSHIIYTCVPIAPRMFHYYDRKYLSIGDRPSNSYEKLDCENMKHELQTSFNAGKIQMFSRCSRSKMLKC